MYMSPDFATKPKALQNRIKLEQRIVKMTVDALLAKGYTLSVFDGEEEHTATKERKAIIDALMETDEDYLNVSSSDNTVNLGWIRFIYGNDGYDVISDYTTNLDEDLAGVNAFAESQG